MPLTWIYYKRFCAPCFSPQVLRDARKRSPVLGLPVFFSEINHKKYLEYEMDIQSALDQALEESHAANLWDQALGILEGEMPKASFDTWLRDTKLSAHEAGVMTVAARNAYAREWLESRVAAACERALSDLTGADTKIRFVVDGEVKDADVEEVLEEEPEARGFAAEVVDATRYQDEVRPEKVVVLPGYALRLLEHGDLTPKQMSLWLGFRQAVYAQRKRGEGTVRNIPHWEVCKFAMMSRASYFREIRSKEDFVAGGLVEKIDSGSMGDANCYRVHMAPRLTRRDCAAIERVLTTEVSEASTRKDGVQKAVDTLNALAERAPADYLEAEDITIGDAWPRSVAEIVRSVIGLEGDLPHELADAAERLTDRILGAYGQVVITHYFLTRVVPALGFSHAQAWAIILLRDRCWFDYETRSQRDFVIVPGGLRTLAKWVGTTRRSVELWANSPTFTAFVQEVNPGGPRETFLKTGEVFWVRQDEPLDLDSEKVSLESEKVRLGLRKSETLGSEILRLLERKSETLLKPLLNPYLNPYKPQNLPPPAKNARKTKIAGKVAVNLPSGWVLDRILQGKVISPKILRQIRGGSGQALVSWLLYALSPEGEGINKPLNYALDRLAQDQQNGAGEKYDQLAAVPPEALIEVAQAAYKSSLTHHDYDNPLVALWLDVMGIGAKERAVTLLRLLLGDNAPIRIEREFRADTWQMTASGAWEHNIEIRSEQT